MKIIKIIIRNILGINFKIIKDRNSTFANSRMAK